MEFLNTNLVVTYSVGSSTTADVINIDTESNVGRIGRYMFRTDLSEIVASTVAQSMAGTGLYNFFNFCCAYHSLKVIT